MDGFWEKIVFSRDLIPNNVRLDPNKVWPSVLSFQRPTVGQYLTLPDNVQLHRIMSDWQFQYDVRSLFWSYFANRVFNWSHSFSAVFITSMGLFLHYWSVYLSPYYRDFVSRVWTWDIDQFLWKNLIRKNRKNAYLVYTRVLENNMVTLPKS
jgi:hypothetical protein